MPAIANAALAGATTAWICFGTLELLLAAGYGFRPGLVVAAQLAVYVLTGLAVGAALALCARASGRPLERAHALALGWLSVALAALLVLNFEEQLVATTAGFWLAALPASALVLLAALLAPLRAQPGPRARRLANAWSLGIAPAALLALFTLRLTRYEEVAAELALAGPLVALAVFGAATGTAAARLRPAARVVVAALAGLGAVLGANAWSAARHGRVYREARSAPLAPRGAQPDVILIVLDTVRADHLGVYGYPRDTTPRLDAFAREALVLAQARSTSSWTLPAHASLFTGSFPHRHGAHSGSPNPVPGLGFGALDAALPTLAETLAANGFRTGAIVANFAAASHTWGLARGFESYDDRQRQRPFPPAGFAESARRRLAAGLRPDLFDVRYRPAAEITARALDWIEAHGDAPVFLFLNYLDAHAPYLAPPPYDRLFGDFDPSFRDPHQAVNTMERRLSDAERRHLVARYDGELRYLDHHVGALFDGLARAGRFDDALIVVTSDHGEAFGEHGFLYHEKTLYDEELRVPLLVRFPGGRGAGTSERPAQLVDVMPTVLAELGIPVPERVQGSDLRGPGGVQMAELYRSRLWLRTYGARFDRDLFAVLDPGGPSKIILSSRGGVEAYRLDLDPAERHDRAAELPARVAASRALRDGVRRALAPSSAAPTAAPADAATLEKLRSLGYVE